MSRRDYYALAAFTLASFLAAMCGLVWYSGKSNRAAYLQGRFGLDRQTAFYYALTEDK